MSEQYLVTGAAGFIGSRVSQMLLDAGHEVVGVDDLNAAYDPRLKQRRIDRLTASPSFRFERTDITDAAAVERLFRISGPLAAVVNLAARAGVRRSIAEPRAYFQTNCEGTLALLDACRQFGVRKFVLASTSSLYGVNNSVPFCETADTDRPLSPYAASKKGAESVVFAYHHLHGIDVTVLRYFTVYGPAGRPDMSVFRFMHQIADGKPITVYGDGSQQRDFTYVDDIARGTIAALRPVGFETVNLGGDSPVRLDAVIEQIANLVGRRPVIRSLPPHPADVLATWANIQRARELFDWRPQISLEEGLRRTAEWHRENHEFVSRLNLAD